MTTLRTVPPTVVNRPVLLMLLAAAGALPLAGGCVITTAPGQSPHGEWAGTYAQRQADADARDRAAALGVRQAFAQDPVLAPLGIRIFVYKGEVTLCGKFPDAATRARAIAVAEGVDGVTGVDTDCGN